MFKQSNVQHFIFNATAYWTSFGKFQLFHFYFNFRNSGKQTSSSTLQLVQIFFDTATFDDIEREKKIKVEDKLSLIGGTMGLLTGFSIISGVEIIFFLFRWV